MASSIDLQREQMASLNRPRHKYSLMARIFFVSMDILAGPTTTLSKVKLLEMLASIPYREWEARQYDQMTRRYKNSNLVQLAQRVVRWGREAQDNEYDHLLVIEEKMKADGAVDPWYLIAPIPWLMVWSYVILARFLAWINLRRAYLFNGEFEDHAERVYAQFVADNPAWEAEVVPSGYVTQYAGGVTNWADVFRRIGLDERDHRNRSFIYAGKKEYVVEYEGMPPLEL